MIKLSALLVALYALVGFALHYFFQGEGMIANPSQYFTFLSVTLYVVFISHITITAMSLSFHRYHTHQGVILNKYIDRPMQVWLWLITGMTKFDWVSIHRYHHVHSDQEKDPHSPIHKGFWRVFFFGVYDYVIAKENPEVIRLRKKITGDSLEHFISKYSLLGPVLMTVISIALLGFFWGSVISLFHFAISPLFAVGGVNALAHWLGYKNHHTKDNSRNIGFLLPLNFIVCGELDHNNHHAHQVSSSFRHKWYEFDIGFIYIKLLSYVGLAKIHHAFSPLTLKEELKKQIQVVLEKDLRIKSKCEQIAAELGTNYQELSQQISRHLHGQRVKLQAPVKDLVKEVKRTMKANYRLKLSY
jgi:stearoyl-CoA desaturase (delta-9 desaturase)